MVQTPNRPVLRRAEYRPWPAAHAPKGTSTLAEPLVEMAVSQKKKYSAQEKIYYLIMKIKAKLNQIIKNKYVKFVYWEIIPIHYISSLINPDKYDNKKPSTISIWLIGIYTAIYGLSSQSYESAISRTKNRIENISNIKEQQIRLNLISEIQNAKMPIEPKYHRVLNTTLGFFGKREKNHEILQFTKLVLIKECDSIVGVKIKDIDFGGIDFKKSILKKAYFKNSKFINCSFTNCSFDDCQFYQSDLSGVWVTDCKMVGINFWGSRLKLYQAISNNLTMADFRNSTLDSSYFKLCNLDSANFAYSHIKTCDFSQSNILNVTSFYNADVDSSLLTIIKSKIPNTLLKSSMNPK
jgi:uncharacterized protein YjbI with pentapeptide repeats